MGHQSNTCTKSTAGGEKKVWTQAFTKGYIGTAFTRACVSSANLYTVESAPYRQHVDARLLTIGRAGKLRHVENNTG